MLVPHTILSKGEGLVFLNNAYITTTTFKDFSLFSNYITRKDSSVSVRTKEDFSGSENSKEHCSKCPDISFMRYTASFH